MKPAVNATSELKPGKRPGFSLVEVLLSMVIMSYILLQMNNLLLKNMTLSNTMDTRYTAAIESQALILDLQQELAQGAYISNNSHTRRLEYTTYDVARNSSKKVYGICYSPATVSSADTSCNVSSGTNNTAYLKLSTDGGSAWGSPYRISPFNNYYLTGGTATFLFAQDGNNCTAFTDTNTNGVWASGEGAAASDCGNYDITTPVLSTPSEATKVILHGFQFAGNGLPLPQRTLPTNVFAMAPQAMVIDTTLGAVAPGVKDAPLMKSFDTSTANSQFGSGCSTYALQWDPSRQRLLVGSYINSTGKIFQIDRMGVLINSPVILSSISTTGVSNSVLPYGIALLDDGYTVMVLDSNSTSVLWYNLKSPAPLQPFKRLWLNNPSDATNNTPVLAGSSDLINSPKGLFYDPKWPNNIFLVGQDPSNSAWKIFEVDTTTGQIATGGALSASSGKLALPAAIDTTHPPSGLSQEPTTGDYLVSRNYVNGATTSKSIDVYRITSAGVSTSISFNIYDLNAAGTAATTTGYWPLSYSPETNHVFFSDVASGKIYEAIPNQLIAPQS
jgi:Tfp pilus assembly protein PilV